MKNKIIFYITIFAPVFALFLQSTVGIMSSKVFVVLMFLYAFIYHPALSTTKTD